MSAHDYGVGPAPRLDVRIERGNILLLPGAEGTIGVELTGPGAEELRVDAGAGSVTIRQPSAQLLRRSAPVEVRVTVPADVRSSLALAAGAIDVRSPVAELQASAASGDVAVVEATGRATLKTASGDIRVDVLSGQAALTSGSGDLTVGQLTGEGRFTTASGDIEVGRLAGDLSARTASGDVDVRRMDEGSLEFRTASGDTTVAISPGRRVRYDVKAVSGRLRLPGPPAASAEEPAEKPLVRIEGRSVSGDTVLEHAPPANDS